MFACWYDHLTMVFDVAFIVGYSSQDTICSRFSFVLRLDESCHLAGSWHPEKVFFLRRLLDCLGTLDAGNNLRATLGNEEPS